MNKILILIISIFLASCSGSKIVTLATAGKTTQETFNEEIKMHYLDKYVFIDVELNGREYTFLFDTGYDISTLDKSLFQEISFTPLTKQKTTGSSIEDIKLQYGYLASLTIADIEFKNFGVGIQDLSHVRSPFSDGRKIYGIIGANFLRKAYWQLDYKKQSIKFSNKIENFQLPKGVLEFNMIAKSKLNWGINRIPVNINGVSDNFVFDTGSYGNLSANPDFLKRLERADKPMAEIKGSKSDIRKFAIDEFQLDSVKISNTVLQIEEGINLLIGNDFLEDYIVTIDWVNNKLYLAKNKA